MRILFCGDVVGRSGRKAVTDYVPVLKEKLKLDFVIVNGENAASGFGITRKICDSFTDAGVDIITSGDHVFDQKETINFIDKYKKLLRPANLPQHVNGPGFGVFDARNGKKILVINILAQVFMKMVPSCPFECVKEILERYKLGKDVGAIVVDFHGEASSERTAMGHYLDGKVSLVSGSHTHVPTADVRILEKKTAYQTDAGMCGDYNSVIGFKKEISIPGFLNKARSEKLVTATGEGTLCGIFVETDDKTGLAKRTDPVRIGGSLQEFIPEID